MGSEHVERRLAVILAADVVGYSRLMGADELGTFEKTRAHRKELFEPEIARHRGRIVKLMGDGLLAEFYSVVDAVSCAIVLQRSMLERNSGVSPERRIDVRIGINLGEVIIEDRDRHGDAINLAARLEQLARPNGICVSEKVRIEVEGKVDIPFENGGEQRLKNIAQPTKVFHWRPDGAPPLVPTNTGAEGIRDAAPANAGAKPSLALSAFEVLGGDAQEWQNRAAQRLSPDSVQPVSDGTTWPAIIALLVGIGLLVFCIVRGGVICQAIGQFLVLMLLSGRSSSSGGSSGGGASFSGGGGSFGGGGASGSW